jgi:hypothetical protein
MGKGAESITSTEEEGHQTPRPPRVGLVRAVEAFAKQLFLRGNPMPEGRQHQRRDHRGQDPVAMGEAAADPDEERPEMGRDNERVGPRPSRG